MTSMAEKKRAKRSGRKLKQGVDRYPGGEIVHHQRGETAEQIMAVAKSAPHRRFLEGERRADSRAGYAGGRLYLSGAISARQLAALNEYEKIAKRYMRIVLGKTPQFATLRLEVVQQPDDSCAPAHGAHEADPSDIFSLKERHAKMEFAARSGEAGDAGRYMLFRVAVMDKEPINYFELGALRSALNNLAQHWGLTNA